MHNAEPRADLVGKRTRADADGRFAIAPSLHRKMALIPASAGVLCASCVRTARRTAEIPRSYRRS